jgi:hypothetical protein
MPIENTEPMSTAIAPHPHRSGAFRLLKILLEF